MINDFIDEIKEKLFGNLNEEMNLLIADLIDLKERCVPNEWRNTGGKKCKSVSQKYMMQVQNCSPLDNDLYSNVAQMKFASKSKKEEMNSFIIS